MQIRYIISSLLLFIVFVNATNLAQRWTKLSALADMKAFGETDLGESILQTIALQLKTGGQFDEVLKLLRNLAASLDGQLTNLRLEFNGNQQRLQAQVRQAEADTARAIKENQDSVNKEKDLSAQVTDLRSANDKGRKQKKSLKADLTDLENARKADDKAFSQRITQQKEVVAVLGEIINRLTNQAIKSDEPLNLAETRSSLLKLKGFGAANPIAALVELTSSFDMSSIRIVIGKLTDLKKQIESSIAEDDDSNRRSIETYKVMSKRMQDLLEKVTTNLDAQKSQLKKASADLVLEQKRQKSNADLQKAAETARKSSQEQLEDLATKFESQEADLVKNLDGVRKALVIIEAENKKATASSLPPKSAAPPSSAPPKSSPSPSSAPPASTPPPSSKPASP